MTAIRPFLKVLCPSCEAAGEPQNCHEWEDVRWSRVMPGSAAEPEPVCQECWDSADYVPCGWHELKPISL